VYKRQPKPQELIGKYFCVKFINGIYYVAIINAIRKRNFALVHGYLPLTNLMLYGSNSSDNRVNKLFDDENHQQAHCSAFLLRRSFPCIPFPPNCNCRALSGIIKISMDPSA
jgi:hypothetical protein